MRYEVILTEQHVYEVEAPTPEVALAVVTGDGRAAGDILSHQATSWRCPVVLALPKSAMH